MNVSVGDLEARVLYAIVHCAGDAYGVSIHKAILSRTSDDIAMGAIYGTLDRLEKKKLVKSSWSEPNAQRGGRRKRLFEISQLGIEALHEYDERFRRMSAGWKHILQGG